jgi:hypothetical protein
MRFMATSLLVTALLTAPLSAADNADVVGQWASEVSRQGQTFEVSFEITEASGALAGTWTSPRGSDDLHDVAWDGTTLRFTRQLSTPQGDFELKYTATLDGDTLNGTLATPRGEREFSAKRAG